MDKKSKILEINRRTDIDFQEKCRLINEVMKQNPKIIIEKKECTHYSKQCDVYCDICDDFFNCRFCHDELLLDHDFNRFRVSKIKCKKCDKIQKVSNKCTQCGIQFGKYFCNICNLFDNNDKKINHCVKCGICRVGEKLKHCDKCNMCYQSEFFENHQCINRYDDNCCFCNENLKTSRNLITTLKCNHLVHTKCLQTYLEAGNYQCPLCKKSVINMVHLWSRIEDYVNNTEMPDEFKDKKNNILCNDCGEKTVTKFHFMYHKCLKCNSWNTSVIN